MSRDGRITRLPLLLLLFIPLGCASLEPDASMTQDATLSAREALALAAEREADREARRLATVPLPPGLNHDQLAPRADSDVKAQQSLREALETLSRSEEAAAPAEFAGDWKPPDPSRETDEEDQRAALELFFVGRQAMQEERHVVAANTFQRAIGYDPHAVALYRELARALISGGQQRSGVRYYERALRLEPRDPESIMTVGLAYANLERYEKAGAIFARRLLDDLSFDHDPAADVLVSFTLVTIFRQLGFDRALTEVASRAVAFDPALIERSVYGPRIVSVYQQRSEILRQLGDAHCRLTEYDEAAAAYEHAAELPDVDPAALPPRRIYAELARHRPYRAQLIWLELIDQDAPISDREIQLARYLHDQVEDVSLLVRAVRKRLEESPERADLVRTAVALLPRDQARPMLSEFLKQRPRDRSVMRTLLQWWTAQDQPGAITAAIELIDRHPDLAATITNQLVFAVPSPDALLEVFPESSSDRLAGQVLRTRIVATLGAFGEAWQLMEQAAERWPDEPIVFWLRMELATLLEEPLLLRRAMDEADRFDHPWTWSVASQASRALSMPAEAIEASQRAMAIMEDSDDDAWPDDFRRAVMVEYAKACAAYAEVQVRRSEQRAWGQLAADASRAALEDDPGYEPAYEVLFLLYGPDGMLSDGQTFMELGRQLYEQDSESPLYDRYVARQELNQRRYDQALERLLKVYENDPSDVQALQLALSAWEVRDRLDAAIEWLNDQRRKRPGDPILLEHWVGAMARANRAAEAIDALEDIIQRKPDHITARRLIESLYRATGQIDRAFRYGEERLTTRPKGPRRETELAALYAGMGMHARAKEHLTWLAEHAADTAPDQLITAVAIIARVDGADEALDRLAIELVEALAMRQAEAPLQVYAIAMRALSRRDEVAETRFDQIARAAARYAQSTAGEQAPIVWRDLAQSLMEDGHAEAAATALRARLREDGSLPDDAFAFLTSLVFVADALVPEERRQVERTIQLIDDLDAANQLPGMVFLEGEPTRAKVFFHASQFFNLLGNESGTLRLLEEAVDADPTHAMAKNNLGYGRLINGQLDERTIHLIERAYELDPDSGSIRDTIGWLRYKQGQLEDEGPDEGEHQPGALTLLEAALDAMSDDPSAEVHDHLGDVLWRLGREDEALEQWRAGLALLNEPAFRTRLIGQFEAIQTRGWGVLVKPPEEMYDELYGELHERLRGKVDAVEAGRPPEIAPILAERSTQP